MSVHDRDSGDKTDKRSSHPSLMERLRSLFGLSHASIRDDIEEALDDTDEAGVFSAQERSMLRNVLGLHELRVGDVMVPRADIIAVSLDMTLGEVLTVFRTAGHSRLPVHGETLDDARGMVHIRDFVAHVATSAGEDTPSLMDLSHAAMARTLQDANILRPVLFVPPSMQALDLLVRMQAFRTHMALVIDEYGGTDGLVSIEDIVEVIVGDIEDEHDEDERPLIDRSADGSFVADGRASLDEVSAAVGADLAGNDDAEEVETIGGLVTSIAGRVPNRGEVVSDTEAFEFEFEILDADPRRVKTVRIRRRSQTRAEPDGGSMQVEAQSPSQSDADAGIHPA